MFRTELRKHNHLCSFIFKGNEFLPAARFGYDWRGWGWCKHGRVNGKKQEDEEDFEQSRQCWKLEIKRKQQATTADELIFDVL